jgi:LmbE family N-acetylglucosaminyl deacetylase
MVIVAHPDDAEFTTAGTVAAWAKAGCRVTYVVCTDGNAGSHEPGMTREKLAEIRRAEQRAACATLGVSEVVFLGYDDGQLQPTLDLRRDLVRVIRQVKPEVIITWDPTVMFVGGDYINHPDHRAQTGGYYHVGPDGDVCRWRLHQPSRSSRGSASGARRGSASKCYAVVVA